MGLSELVVSIVSSSQERKTAYSSWRKAEREYEESVDQLIKSIKRRFEHYLIDNPQIPKEEFSVALTNRDGNYAEFGPYHPLTTYKSFNRNEEERNVPFSLENLSVKITFGKPEEPDMHDTMFGPSPPTNVTSKFSDFLEQNKPVDVRIFRYFDDFGNIIEFYGTSDNYERTGEFNSE